MTRETDSAENMKAEAQLILQNLKINLKLLFDSSRDKYKVNDKGAYLAKVRGQKQGAEQVATLLLSLVAILKELEEHPQINFEHDKIHEIEGEVGAIHEQLESDFLSVMRSQLTDKDPNEDQKLKRWERNFLANFQASVKNLGTLFGKLSDDLNPKLSKDQRKGCKHYLPTVSTTHFFRLPWVLRPSFRTIGISLLTVIVAACASVDEAEPPVYKPGIPNPTKQEAIDLADFDKLAFDRMLIITKDIGKYFPEKFDSLREELEKLRPKIFSIYHGGHYYSGKQIRLPYPMPTVSVFKLRSHGFGKLTKWRLVPDRGSKLSVRIHLNNRGNTFSPKEKGDHARYSAPSLPGREPHRRFKPNTVVIVVYTGKKPIFPSTFDRRFKLKGKVQYINLDELSTGDIEDDRRKLLEILRPIMGELALPRAQIKDLLVRSKLRK